MLDRNSEGISYCIWKNTHPPSPKKKRIWRIFFVLFCWVSHFEGFLNNEIKRSVLDSTEKSVGDFLRESIPELIHKFNFTMDNDNQIVDWAQSIETVPNSIMWVARNLFLIEVCPDQCFKFIFIDADFCTILTLTLRRLGIIPLLWQIGSSKVPLLEFLIKVKTYFLLLFLRLWGSLYMFAKVSKFISLLTLHFSDTKIMRIR